MTRVGSSRDDESVHAEAGAHVQLVKIGLGRETIAMIIVLSLVIGACTYVLGLNMAKQDQMDRDFKEASTRLTLNERRLMDKEAYMILNGQKIEGDDIHGPTGNTQRMIPKETQNGRR
jgi:hypothetical protein